jgi:hypothetical protein
MSALSDFAGRPENDWRLDHYKVANTVTGRILTMPIMTNGQCIVTALRRPGPLAHHFKYEETWTGSKLEFEFEAIFIGAITSTTYQVFLGRALERRPEYWTGSLQDNALLYHLMANIRRALCLLRSGPSEESRIKTVEFVLSRSSHWRTLSGFQSEEIVR